MSWAVEDIGAVVAGGEEERETTKKKTIGKLVLRILRKLSEDGILLLTIASIYYTFTYKSYLFRTTRHWRLNCRERVYLMTESRCCG